MHNGNGHGPNGKDRYGPSRRQKKYRELKRSGRRMMMIECDKEFVDILDNLCKGENGFSKLTPAQLRFLEAAVAADAIPLISL